MTPGAAVPLAGPFPAAVPAAAVMAPLALAGELNAALRRFAPAYVAPLPHGIHHGARGGLDRCESLLVFTCGHLDVRRAAGFFVRLRPDGADVMAGCVAPGSRQLATLHEYIANHHVTVRRILCAPAVQRAMGRLRGSLASPAPLPPGIPDDHPAAGLLRHREFYYQRAIGSAIAHSPRFLPAIVSSFRAAAPVVELLDMALGNL